jgi:hypothetical protein
VKKYEVGSESGMCRRCCKVGEESGSGRRGGEEKRKMKGKNIRENENTAKKIDLNSVQNIELLLLVVL